MLTLERKMGKCIVVDKGVCCGHHYRYTAMSHMRRHTAWVTPTWNEFVHLKIWTVVKVCRICFFGALLHFVFPKTIERWVLKS